MTDLSEPERTQAAPGRWRFRFGLRSIFVVMTILCVWLAYKMTREHRATEMNARYHLLLDAIVSDIANTPPDTFYRINPGSHDELQRKSRWPDEEFQRNTILRTGSAARTGSWMLVLDISQALANTSRKDIAQQLLNHYSQRLDKVGMRRGVAYDGSNFGGAKSRGVWASSGNELSVIVDIDVAAEVPTAEVRILVIDSQQLNLW